MRLGASRFVNCAVEYLQSLNSTIIKHQSEWYWRLRYNQVNFTWAIMMGCRIQQLYTNATASPQQSRPDIDQKNFWRIECIRQIAAWIVVAKGGIEPPTQGFSVLCSTNWATWPAWIKITKTLPITGAPGRIRTHDPLVRSQVLYPTELRALGAICFCMTAVLSREIIADWSR